MSAMFDTRVEAREWGLQCRVVALPFTRVTALTRRCAPWQHASELNAELLQQLTQVADSLKAAS